MGALDENAARIARTLAWMKAAIQNVNDNQALIERRQDKIESEQRRQARVLAFVQRRQRAGGKLTRGLLAKQKRALQKDLLLYGNPGYFEDLPPAKSTVYRSWCGPDGVIHHDIRALGTPIGSVTLVTDQGFEEIPLYDPGPDEPMLRAEFKAAQRAKLLRIATELSPVMSGQEEGSRRGSETTALRVLPADTCDTCDTELIDNCLRCGAPVCCPKCCVEAERERNDVAG